MLWRSRFRGVNKQKDGLWRARILPAAREFAPEHVHGWLGKVFTDVAGGRDG